MTDAICELKIRNLDLKEHQTQIYFDLPAAELIYLTCASTNNGLLVLRCQQSLYFPCYLYISCAQLDHNQLSFSWPLCLSMLSKREIQRFDPLLIVNFDVWTSNILISDARIHKFPRCQIYYVFELVRETGVLIDCMKWQNESAKLKFLHQNRYIYSKKCWRVSCIVYSGVSFHNERTCEEQRLHKTGIVYRFCGVQVLDGDASLASQRISTKYNCSSYLVFSWSATRFLWSGKSNRKRSWRSLFCFSRFALLHNSFYT